ncbi:MAG: HAD superfamily hydrolase (TIGR01490 family) [Halieaceae bacterium]
MALAIFDLDNTLLGGDSDHSWGEFLIAKGLVDKDSYGEKNDWFYQQYLLGQLDITAWLEFSLAPLVDQDPQTLGNWHAEFMRDWIMPMMLPAAASLLTDHRDRGDFLLIITATNGFVTRPIAELLGVDDILASEGEIIDGRYTGRASGVPCYQEGKVERLQQWLDETGHSREDSYFYSDSRNDLPLLCKVAHPIAVDPDEVLKQYALDHNWKVISLR